MDNNKKKNVLLNVTKEFNEDSNLIGKTITLGYNNESDLPIEWEVIAKNDEYVLVLSKYILKQIPFSLKLHQDDYNMYHDGLIREYLSKEFIKFFSNQELDLIESFGKDKFYILSSDDLIRYFNIDYKSENLNLRAKPEPSLYSNGFETNESGYGKYWLKSFDSKHDYAQIIDSFGNITRAKINNPTIGIRVCCWIKRKNEKKYIE